MAEMEITTIQEKLAERFKAERPEGSRRRVVFWLDPAGQFADKRDALELDGVKIVEWKRNETFRLKKLLCYDDLESNYLIYQPFAFDSDEDDWLLNVRLYSEQFLADLNSIRIDEMGLSDTTTIREEVERYSTFFNAKARRDAVKKLNEGSKIVTKAHMSLAVMAAICGLDVAKPSKILRAVLLAGFDPKTNRIYCDLEKYGADKIFWELARQVTEFVSKDEYDRLEALAAHLILTATTRSLYPDYFTPTLEFHVCERPTCKSFCYDVVSEWLTEDAASLQQVARDLEETLRIPEIFSTVPLQELSNVEFFPSADEAILTTLFQEVDEGTIDAEKIRQTYEKRRVLKWFDETRCFYLALLQLANMKAFADEHAAGYHLTDPKEIWKAYEEDYYKMDAFYREFHYHFQKSLLTDGTLRDELLKIAKDVVEPLYVYDFLERLSVNWNKASEDNLANYGHILEIPKQEDFYLECVQERSKRKPNEKTFVIVSDALRYETAASLVDELRREYQAEITLSSRQAIFPTITEFGMAALLPHENIEVVENGAGRLDVLVDGQPTSDLASREAALKRANEASLAFKYSDFLKLTKQKRRELFSGVNVFYFYHDRIDQSAHTSDDLLFEACESAIEDLKSVVNKLINDYKSAKIIITSDHGFLYTNGELSPDNKVPSDFFANDAVEYGRRYAITRKAVETDKLLSVKFLDGTTDYRAYAPLANVRIVKSGSGTNFVHGGTSLQETVVPVVELVSLRPTSNGYKESKEEIDTKLVTLNLASSNDKISNMVFWLKFYQTEPIGPNRKSATYRLYFVDSKGEPVSDESVIVADKTSGESQERVFRCTFNLRSIKFNKTDDYYLIIKADPDATKRDEKVRKAAHVQEQKIPFQIDIPFATEDFNFLV